MERAIAFHGGVTEVDVFDNMKIVVLGRVANKPIFAPRFAEYSTHAGATDAPPASTGPSDEHG